MQQTRHKTRRKTTHGVFKFYTPTKRKPQPTKITRLTEPAKTKQQKEAKN
jgi:hypothetical protein